MNNPTYPVPEKPPDQAQTVTALDLQFQIFQRLLILSEQHKDLTDSIQTLNATLALHIKQNIETFDAMNEYIAEQIRYRVFRQGMEENNLQLELDRKNIELKYLEDKIHKLETEVKEDDDATLQLKLDRERQHLEIEALKRNIDILENVKKSTKDRIPSVKTAMAQPSLLPSKIKDTIMLTAIGTLTAAATTGAIAFAIWVIRFYIEHTPK